MTPRQTDNVERTLGQLQGQVEAMAESLRAIVKQTQEGAATASDERHEMLSRMTAMNAQITAARADIAAMKPLHDRLQKSGWIVTGILLGAGLIGGAVGAKFSVIWAAIYGVGK